MIKIGKELVLSALLCLGSGCGEKRVSIVNTDGGMETSTEAGSEPKCTIHRIRLNFEGVFDECPVPSNYDPATYCPAGTKGRVLIDGYKGENDRNAEISRMVNLFRCFLKPTGVELEQSDKPQELVSDDPYETRVNIGGKVPVKESGAVISGSIMSINVFNGEVIHSPWVAEEAVIDNRSFYRVKPAIATRTVYSAGVCYL